MTAVSHTAKAGRSAIGGQSSRGALASLDVAAAWRGTFGSRKLRAALLGEPRVVTRPSGSGFVEVQGRVHDPGGAKVGVFGRTVFERNDGSRWVKHDGLFLDEGYQGTGFASEFNAHAENLYRSWGVREVRVSAVDVGSYTWARQGFTFAVPDATATSAAASELERARKAAEMVATAHAKGRITDSELAGLRSRLVSGDTVQEDTLASPGQIAALSGDMGRRILLGSEWSGVKLLTP